MFDAPLCQGLYDRLQPADACQPFRRMLGHPEVCRRLDWLCGPGYREVAEPMCCIYPPGTPGGQLHGQNTADVKDVLQ